MKLIQIKILIFLITFSSSMWAENTDKPYLGSIKIADLFNKYPLFKEGYDNYVSSKLSTLKDDDISVVIFFGTWCHDSKRDLPKALKILSNIDIKDENIELIGVGLDKKEPMGRAEKLNLMFTPTIIFFKNSKEVGRIIEKPVRSLEEDIEAIISSI